MSNVDVDLPSTAVVVELSEGSVNVPVIGASPGGTGDGGTFDGEHNDLDGRSTADAHPISAITGLTAALVGLQTVGWDFLYDGVNFDLSTDEIDGVPRTVVLAAGARVGTHELPLRAATESDAGQHWSIEYFCGGDGFTVLRVPDPLGESPQYVDLAGLKVDGWIVDMVGVWDSDTETGFWALHAIYDRRGDESGGGAVDSVNGETGVVVLDAADVGAVDVALVGAANGIAELDSGGLVPSSQLPSYVDDVIEAANFAALPGTGETGKIYVTLDNNLTYRWSGSAYVEISASLALGETSSTAYRGDRGKTAYDHSQETTGNPHGTVIGDISGLQTAIDAKAPLASPTFTGTPAAPTPSANDNSTKLATTAYVDTAAGLSGAWSVISDQVLVSDTASVTVSGLSSYKEVRFSLWTRSTDTAVNYMYLRGRMNGDTSTAYRSVLYGRSGSGNEVDALATDFLILGWMPGSLTYANRVGHVTGTAGNMDASSMPIISTRFGQYKSNGSNQTGITTGTCAGVREVAGLISSLTFYAASGNLASGSIIVVEGRA